MLKLFRGHNLVFLLSYRFQDSCLRAYANIINSSQIIIFKRWVIAQSTSLKQRLKNIK